MSESRVGGRVECGFHDARRNFDRFRSPPPSLSSLRRPFRTRKEREEHVQSVQAGGRARLPPPRCRFFVPDFLTQRQRGNHFRARRCHFGSERVSGFEKISASQRPPRDGAGVPLTWLTDQWCQQRGVEGAGEDERRTAVESRRCDWVGFFQSHW